VSKYHLGFVKLGAKIILGPCKILQKYCRIATDFRGAM